ncbi:MAG: ABC transporter ATP-binding protein [Pseudomonadota bacterium]|nr:ABC transporter ATP-binding protein [Pseudomonadota bacterium]
MTRGLRYCWPGQTTELSFPDLTLNRGEHLFVRGPSGTGKSTFLSLLAGMMLPSAGTLQVMGEAPDKKRAGARDRFRADHLGVIFQQFNLVPYLSALGNVTLPCRLSKTRLARTAPSPEAAGEQLLSQLAIPESHWHQSVQSLSIGQQQRVAAARALIGAPELILADEPTSALDTDNRDRFLDLLLGLAAERQSSVVFVSHDRSLAGHFHNQLVLGGDR